MEYKQYPHALDPCRQHAFSGTAVDPNATPPTADPLDNDTYLVEDGSGTVVGLWKYDPTAGAWREIETGGASGPVTTTSLTPQVYQGAAYVSAQAHAAANVADLLLLSDGTRIETGKVTWPAHGLTVGAYYFLDQAAAGGYTEVVPSAGLSQRLFFVEDANTIHVDVEPAEDLSMALVVPKAKYVGVTTGDPVVQIGNFRVRFQNSSTDLQISTVAGSETIKYYTTGFYNGGRVGGHVVYNKTITTAWTTFGDPGAIFFAEMHEAVFTPLNVVDQRAFRFRYTGWDVNSANPRKIIMELEQI